MYKMNKKQSKSKVRLSSIMLAVFLAAALLLAACGSDAEQTDQPADSGESADTQVPQSQAEVSVALVGTPWVLVGYGDASNPIVVEDGTLVTMFLGPDSAVNGIAGCNTYNTTYTMEGDQLTIASPIATTMMACEKGMEQETAYLSALQTAQSYVITEQGNLNIKFDSGAGYEEVLIYIPERAPLEGSIWTLVSMGPVDNPQPVVAGANFTAQFVRDPNYPTGALTGGTGCNEYRSTYYASDNEMKINLPAATANSGCPAGLPEQEQAYYQALNQVRSYRIASQDMQMYYGDQVLNYAIGGAPAPAPTEAPAASDLSPLNGTKWWLNSIETASLIPGTEITAEFYINPDGVTGTVSGFSGCNTYTGDITGMFTVANITSTQTACDQAVMDQETTYLAALGTSSAISFDPTQVLITSQFGILAYGSSPEAAPPIETETPQVEQPIATETPEVEQPIATETPEVEQPIATAEAPVVIITITPDPSTAGGETTFDGSQSYAGEGANVVSYSWDFGDGSPAMEGATVSHGYAAAGTYTVSLTVTDSLGQTAQGQYPLTVQ